MVTVADLITDAQEYASTSFTEAQTIMDNVQAAIDGIRSSYWSYSAPPLAEPSPYAAREVPAFIPVNLTLPADPGEFPDLLGIPAIDLSGQPTAPTGVPTIDAPAKPSGLPEFTTAAPVITTSFTFPEPPAALSRAEIEMPVVGEVTLPANPNVVLPSFTAEAPADPDAPPTDYAADFVANYRDAAPTMYSAIEGQADTLIARYNPQFTAQMAALESKLAEYIEGGSALSESVENALFERTKDKITAEARRATRDTLRAAAKRGITMHDGVMNANLRSIRVAGIDGHMRAAVEVYVKQAELEQQNIQFAITTSTGLRNAMLSATIAYHGNLIQINGQAMEYARALLNTAIELYNTQVKFYTAKLDVYRAQAAVYESRIRGAMAAVDLYRAELSAAETQVGVDRAKLDAYRIQIDGLQAYADVYKTRVDVVLGTANLEKLKLEMFDSQVRAYGSQVQAKGAEWDAYRTAYSGEEMKVKVFGAQVDAYSAQLAGYNAKIGAQTEAIRAVTATNSATSQQYSSQVEAYRAKVAALGQKANVEIALNESALNAFKAGVAADVSAQDAALQYYKTKAELIQSDQATFVTSQKAIADLNISKAKAIADASISAGTVYGNLAGAAISGMNTIVSQSE
jgi:hypothetical protein